MLSLAIISLIIPKMAMSYNVDISPDELIKDFKVPTIDSLAVGEKGILNGYATRMCIDNGTLKIDSWNKLVDTASKYSVQFVVTREPGNFFNVQLSDKGKKPDEEDIINNLMTIATAHDCSEFDKIGAHFYPISEFFGKSSLSESRDSILSFKSLPEPAVSPKQSTPSKMTSEPEWYFNTSKSPIDDSPSVFMSKSDQSSETNLILRCKENQTSMYIVTNDYLTDDRVHGLIRFDDSDAVSHQFSISTDNKALFFSNPIAQIKKLLETKRLSVRYNSYNGSQYTRQYNTDGLEDKLSALREACNW
jgi:type VI secretion system protein VasI